MKANENLITEFDLYRCVLMSSCNGLVCIQYENKQSYVLLNPLRRDFLTLPQATIKADCPEPVIVTCGFGFDASTSAYKVVRVVCRTENLTSRVEAHRVGTSYWREDLTPRIEVHRVGTSSWRENLTSSWRENLTSRVEVHRVGTSSWREIGEVPPHPVEENPVFAHGFLHWLVSPFRRESEGMIVSFHIGTEKFQWTPHPKFDATYIALFQLVDMKGNLGIVDLSSKTNIDIWVQKDYKNKEWVRQYRIDIRAPCGRSNIGHIQVIGLWENGEILLISNDGFFI
ncbi:F-box protein At3g07870-like [Actinidia eriantha]|uniref:F-box protein At3g07870-like n=1 Tax=Actinidia eriantha TaxID=165200 RepID=UPI0025871790|nr:F-box protein At3g07870-like [Actinidia eriantha]